MQSQKLSLCIVLMVVLAGCAKPKTVSTVPSQGSKYSEDLSALRPKPEVVADNTAVPEAGDKKPEVYIEPKLTVNRQLDNVLDSIDQINLSRRYIEGFTIQVYSGRREEALSAKKQLATSLPRLSAEVQFTEPIFRVKVGKYYSRLDAQQDYAAVKRYFPAAILIPEKITMQ